MIKRLAEVALELTPQRMEIVGGRGAIEHLHVVFGTQLQEALGTGRGMLGALAFIAMGQQHHQTRHAQPLALAGRDELVDHHLRAVHEIAELGFPDGQRIGLGKRIAIFEPEHGLFAQKRIDDLIARLPLTQIVERGIGLLDFLIVKHRVPLGEGAPLHVLARKPDRMALIDQGCERQRFSGRPIDALALGDDLFAIVEETLHRAVNVKALGHRAQLFAQLAKPVGIGAGDPAARSVHIGELDVFPRAIEPVGLVGAVVLTGLELGFQMAAPCALDLIGFLLAHHTFVDQLFAIDVIGGPVRPDRLVHQRLGEAGLIAFIVAEPAIAEHVDDDGLAEFLAVFGGDLGRINDGFGIVAIDVENRSLDHFRHIGGIRRGPREMR